jgi:branched-chain amino acid transport system ATP-binding protein
VERLAEALVEVNKTGLTILVVEQDVLTALDFVIELGRIGMSGETRLLAEDQKIRQAYMGI